MWKESKRKGRYERAKEERRGGDKCVLSQNSLKQETNIHSTRLSRMYGPEYTMIHYTLFLHHTAGLITYRLRKIHHSSISHLTSSSSSSMSLFYLVSFLSLLYTLLPRQIHFNSKYLLLFFLLLPSYQMKMRKKGGGRGRHIWINLFFSIFLSMLFLSSYSLLLTLGGRWEDEL